MSFKYSDFKKFEMIKVLIHDEEEDIDEEQWAKVMDVSDTCLYVTYFCDGDKTYKGASVYSFEPKINTVNIESILEHHEGVIDVKDLGVLNIERNMYVFEDEIDQDDSDSEIEDQDDELEDEYECDGFVVDDNTIDGKVELPPDHVEVDQDWNKWKPRSNGEKRFKEMVDNIDAMARMHMDNLNF